MEGQCHPRLVVVIPEEEVLSEFEQIRLVLTDHAFRRVPE